MAEKAFASTGDTGDKTVSFVEIGPGLYAYTAQGDPNSGIIVGDDGCMVIDAQATPAMAADVIARVRTVTDKPIRYVVLSHYHAVRVLGASAYKAQGIIASNATYDLIVERGAGQGLRDRPLPAPVPRREQHPGRPHLADADLRERHVGVPRQAGGEAVPPRRRPYGG